MAQVSTASVVELQYTSLPQYNLEQYTHRSPFDFYDVKLFGELTSPKIGF